MAELLIILGAAALFCVLVFGAAYLAAGWVSATPGRWRRPGRRERKDPRD